MIQFKWRFKCRLPSRLTRRHWTGFSFVFLMWSMMWINSNATASTTGHLNSSKQTSSAGLNVQDLNFKGLKTDIPIGKVDNVELVINIARPSNPSNSLSPAIVFVHGGGLIKGSHHRFNKQIESMAKRGVVAASVMYRLAPKYRFPAPLEDVQAAIRFLKAHSAQLGLDPNRIVVSGVSSGGYLATMIGVIGNDKSFSTNGLYPEYDSSVRAIISQSGHIADFTAQKYQEFAVVERFINLQTPDRQAALAAMSPITYLDKHDPPFFLSHGDEDERVPVSMTRDFVAHLKIHGHEHQYIEVEGGKHSLQNSNPEGAKQVFRSALAFFKKHGFEQ